MAIIRSRRRLSLKGRMAVMLALASAMLFVPAVHAGASEVSQQSLVYYQLVARHSNKCAHVVDASQANGALVQQRYCWQPRHQHWRLAPSSVASGYYELRALHSDKCLGVRGGSYNDGALIHQWQCNGARSQQWVYESVEGGWYRLRALHSGKCLDVRYADEADWTPLQQWQCGSQFQQQWSFS
jgi:hypothetical protein